MTTLKVMLTSSALLLSAISAGAQQPATPAAPAAPAVAPPAAAPAAPLVYGAPITLEMAKRAVAAAEAEARKNNWNVMIVVLDSGGHTVMSAGRHAIRVDPYRSRQGAHGTRVQAPD